MDIAAIRSLRRAEPFRPFVLRLVDGRKIRVRERESLAVGKNSVAVIGAKEEIEIVDPSHVVAIENRINK